MVKNIVKNICVLLLVAMISSVLAGYYGFKWGQEFYNKWLVISAWNEGYTTGKIDGAS